MSLAMNYYDDEDDDALPDVALCHYCDRTMSYEIPPSRTFANYS
jgi:hypothetical protein